MINILIPMAGKFELSDAHTYPRPLLEIYDRSMIEIVLENLFAAGVKGRFIFIVKDVDCNKFNLHKILNLITDHQCLIVRLKGETKGAACSALMAVDHIMNDIPLIIANSDQIFDDDLGKAIKFFNDQQADGGVLVFESVQPRWSYVRIENKVEVVEAAEKVPISKHAIAGFYYFRHGHFFVQAAMKSIQKDNHLNGNFFIAPVFNELILENHKVVAYRIENDRYHTLYTPQRIKAYKEHLLKSSLSVRTQ